MYRLYGFHGSGNSYKPGLLFALLGLDVNKIEIDLTKGEHHSPEFLKLNPVGEVPVLVDGDVVLRDSAAILVYIAGRHAARSWWSQDASEQAEIIGWLTFSSSWIQYGLTIARAILVFGGAYSGVGKVAHENSLREAQIRGRSCPLAWCSFGEATTITGLGRDDQAARVGRLMRGSSPIGAMLSRVM